MIATFYALSGLTATGLLISWLHGNPRLLAVPPEWRSRLGSVACLTFPGGDRIAYRVEDVCPACEVGTVDLLVSSPERARRLGRMRVGVEWGGCR